ncbi:MAG TPA: hypothetical protein VGJ88_02545 [Thermoanaerobaculia bacterium]
MPRHSRLLPLVGCCFFLFASCANEQLIRRVKSYSQAHRNGDVALESQMLSPDARTWYESRSGEGEPLRPGRTGRYAHWDAFFHSRSVLSGWVVRGRAVTATVHETNDFYRLLDWKPNPYQMTWWFDDHGRITGVMVRSLPRKETSRMQEFRAWAAVHDPTELEYVMPKGKLDPTGDRAERWKALLVRWRAGVGLKNARPHR